jgi:hypothetical protein
MTYDADREANIEPKERRYLPIVYRGGPRIDHTCGYAKQETDVRFG